MEKIQTYIINLKHRTDRCAHIVSEFHGRDEFVLNIVEAHEHNIGAVGLWNTIRSIIQTMVPEDEAYILICEDDHQFTKEYNRELLFNSIEEAKLKETDVLIGGSSWFESVLQISDNLFWVDKFSGLQFAIVFRNFFQTILDAEFGVADAADYKISSLSGKKLLMHDYISIQKEFGYSDVTPKNNMVGYVDQIFSDSSEKLNHLKKVNTFYNISNLIRKNESGN